VYREDEEVHVKVPYVDGPGCRTLGAVHDHQRAPVMGDLGHRLDGDGVTVQIVGVGHGYHSDVAGGQGLLEGVRGEGTVIL